MVLLDSSVWIDHLRRGNSRAAALLGAGEVACHPLIIGELACGGLKQRREILGLLSALPRSAQASHDEILAFIESRRLHGRGMGLIDAHLLWAALDSSLTLWTLDLKLRSLGDRLGVAHL